MGRRVRVDRTAEEKCEIVLEGLRSGNIAETSRRYEIAPNLCYRWKDEALQGATAALGGRSVAAATASIVAQTANCGDGLIKTSGEGQTAAALWRAIAACGRRGASDGSLKTRTLAGMNEPDAKEWRGKINS